MINQFQQFSNFPDFTDHEEYNYTVFEKHYSIPNKKKAKVKDIEQLINEQITFSKFDKLYKIISTTDNKEIADKITDYFINTMNNCLKLITNSNTIGELKHSNSYFFKDNSDIFSYTELSIDENEDSKKFEKTEDKLCLLFEYIPVIYQHINDEVKVTNYYSAFSKIFMILSPSMKNGKYSEGHLNYFKYAAKAAYHMLILYRNDDFSKEHGAKFADFFLTSFFDLCTNLTYLSKITNTNIEKYHAYIKVLFPAFSEAVQLLPSNHKIVVHHLWISIVVLCGDIIEKFPEYINEIKKISSYTQNLAFIGDKLNYNDALLAISSLLTLINANYIRTNEDVGIMFNKIVPSISAKVFANLSESECFLLYSIAILEKARVLSGNFSSFFQYFENEHNPIFSQCLNAMISPLFDLFRREGLKTLDFIKRKKAIEDLSICLIKEYHGLNQSYIQFVDTCISILNSKGLLFSHNIISLLIERYLNIEEIIPTRQQSYEEILKKEISKSFDYAPNLFLGYLIHFFLPKIQVKNKNVSFSKILCLIPEKFQDRLLNEIFIISSHLNLVSYISENQILQIQDDYERLALLALKIVQENNTKLLKNLISKNTDKSTLLMIWSYVSTYSKSLSKQFTNVLVIRFINSIKQCNGIFSTKYNEKEVSLQTAIIIFFLEQISTRNNVEKVCLILGALSESIIIETPGTFSAIIALTLLISIILHSNSSPNLLYIKISKFYISLLIKIIVLKSSPVIYRYIDKENLIYLKKIISYISPNFRKMKFNPKEKLLKTSNLEEIFNLYVKNNAMKNKINYQLYQKFGEAISWILFQIYAIFISYISPNENQFELTEMTNKYTPRWSDGFNISVLTKLFWKYSPASIPPISEVLLLPDLITNDMKKICNSFPYQLAFYPQLPFYISKVKINDLALFELTPPENTITLLNEQVLVNETASNYLIRCLEQFETEDVLQFIPQIIQALRFDVNHKLADFITKISKKSEVFSHYILWNILYEKCRFNTIDDNLPEILMKIEEKIIKNMTSQQKVKYEHEFKMIDIFDELSQKLLKFPIEERRNQLIDELKQTNIPDNIYVPSNPNYQIISIDSKNSIPLKSHAKVPILIRFNVRDINSDKEKQMQISCIFKIQDDVRMDAMIIQFIDKFLKIFENAGIECYMKPYRVFATGKERGVIENITNAKSRHDIGCTYKEDLLCYYTHKFGKIGTPEFSKAQNNFIISMAPYSLLCYIFQIKDRHNANIMIDEEGHIIHIDFGFIFDISPGGNLRFERAPFKLSREMIGLMGGSKDAPPFQKFIKLYTQCFIAARSNYDEIESIASLMINAGFPCFKKDTFVRLKQRFFLDKFGTELMSCIDNTINDSMSSLTTSAYDIFQYSQNKIFYV